MFVYKVDICGVTTSKLPVLKDDEKEELFEKIKKGDKAAREKYIRGNLRLVLSVIRRFSNHNENMDDLFQIGCIVENQIFHPCFLFVFLVRYLIHHIKCITTISIYRIKEGKRCLDCIKCV